MNWQSILSELRPLEAPLADAPEPRYALSEALDRLVSLVDRTAKMQYRSAEANEATQRTVDSLRTWVEAELVSRERELESLRVRVGEREDDLRRFTLVITDMLDLLVSAEAAARREKLPDVSQWLERLAREQAKLARRLDIEPSAHVGEEFNPDLHEALDLVEADGPSKSIVEVVRQGYRWRGEVARVAKVTVRL